MTAAMQLSDNIRSILADKGTLIFSVSPSSPVYDAIETMSDRHIGALLVMSGSELVGIFTERDYARKLILQGKSSKDTTVAEVMTPDPLTVAPEDSIDHCMHLMTENRVRHLPVMESGQVVGVVSIGDLVKAIISAHEATIAQLHSYIAGVYPG
jgi:CBS domain-containing protein